MHLPRGWFAAGILESRIRHTQMLAPEWTDYRMRSR